MKRVEAKNVSEELWPGVSPELLKALHILTRDGALNADSRRKLKQVQHLIGLIKPSLQDLVQRYGSPRVVDCGAGKGYLGLLLAQSTLSGTGNIVNIEQRQELIAKCKDVAQAAGLNNVQFVAERVDAYKTSERVHLVTALHACDTATDDALFLALTHSADYIAVVPCCQAEVAAQLKDNKSPENSTASSDEALTALYAYPLHRRELGSHLTNVLRALTLQAHGYQVTVTELVGFEHSVKNEIILGRRVHREHKPSAQKLARVLEAFGVRPRLQRLLAGEA